MTKVEYIVSGCLAGLHCKYNGGSNPVAQVIRLCEEGKAIAVCPESLSGLPVPREPSEWKGNRVFSKSGKDVTDEFEAGSTKALELALKSPAKKAILKARSPSCGSGEIYDGSFSGKLCAGNGIFARKLIKEGFEIYTEDNLPPELN